MTPTRNMAFNGNGQFFVITRWSDGSADQAGPYASPEDAMAEIATQERVDREIEAAEAMAWEDDMVQMRWAEAGGYAAGLCRPMHPREAVSYRTDSGSDALGYDDIPF